MYENSKCQQHKDYKMNSFFVVYHHCVLYYALICMGYIMCMVLIGMRAFDFQKNFEENFVSHSTIWYMFGKFLLYMQNYKFLKVLFYMVIEGLEYTHRINFLCITSHEWKIRKIFNFSRRDVADESGKQNNEIFKANKRRNNINVE